MALTGGLPEQGPREDRKSPREKRFRIIPRSVSSTCFARLAVHRRCRRQRSAPWVRGPRVSIRSPPGCNRRMAPRWGAGAIAIPVPRVRVRDHGLWSNTRHTFETGKCPVDKVRYATMGCGVIRLRRRKSPLLRGNIGNLKQDAGTAISWIAFAMRDSYRNIVPLAGCVRPTYSTAE